MKHENETRAAMLARQARELEALEKRQGLETALADNLPAGLHRAHDFPTPWAVYTVETLREALALFCATREVVPYWSAVNGCRYLDPLERLEAKRQVDHIDGGPFAMALEVETVAGQGPRVRVYWWTRAAGFLARVMVDIETGRMKTGPRALAAGCNETRSPAGRVVRSRQWVPNLEARALADRVFGWATGDQLNRARHTYVWAADDDETAETGAAWAHAAGMVEILADRLEALESTNSNENNREG